MSDDEARPLTPPLQKGAGCLTAAVALAAVVVAAVSFEAAGARARGATFFAAALLAIAAGSRRLPLDRAALRLALVAVAPAIVPLALTELWGARVPPGASELDFVRALASLSWVVPPLALIMAAIGRMVARALLAKDRPLVVMVLRALAWTATIGGAALLAVAITSVRHAENAAALAAFGVLAAMNALLRRPRSPLPADESTWRDADAFLDGTLRLRDDTERLPFPPGVPPRMGPVVAVLAKHADSFRDHARPVVTHVVPGTIAEHRLATRVGPAALALALATIASTPLLTTLLYLR